MAIEALWRRQSSVAAKLVGTANEREQSIVLEQTALDYVFRHRQISSWSNEAGGQLFGTVDQDVVRVTHATGPYPGDERSRVRYRSNPAAAQRAIAAQSNLGLLYLGEWHTHAEDMPQASNLDNDAMQKLINSSDLNVTALLMLIVGRLPSEKGLALFSITTNSTLAWNFRQEVL